MFALNVRLSAWLSRWSAGFASPGRFSPRTGQAIACVNFRSSFVSEKLSWRFSITGVKRVPPKHLPPLDAFSIQQVSFFCALPKLRWPFGADSLLPPARQFQNLKTSQSFLSEKLLQGLPGALTTRPGSRGSLSWGLWLRFWDGEKRLVIAEL